MSKRLHKLMILRALRGGKLVHQPSKLGAQDLCLQRVAAQQFFTGCRVAGRHFGQLKAM